MLNKDFYPTPAKLISRMIAKIKGSPTKILEPSAGKGDIIERLLDQYADSISGSKYRLNNISAIEINEDLQATLRGKDINVLDTDFLAYSGQDKFDLIIANPPFDEGDKHLLKAIDIMYRGQIIFLLNAETIKNPYTNTRKELVKRLSELNAEIEYIQHAFKDAERSTGVEIALIYINIERNIEDDLFAGLNDVDKEEDILPGIDNDHEVSTKKTIEELVAEYNQIVKIGSDTLISYYKNYKKIRKYLGLNKEADKDYHFTYSSDEPAPDLTSIMQEEFNDMLVKIRTDFWRRTLDLSEVRSRLTSQKQDEFETLIKDRCHMDFTESNIRQFVLNLIGGFEKTITEAVMEIFKKFTVKHCFSDGLYDDNIHYFNGWKTNKAFKVNKKVVIPIHAGYGDGPFRDYGKWRLYYDAAKELRDIDIVMNYFNGMGSYISISNAIEHAFERSQSSQIQSTFFTITCYKKGTIHLVFNDEDILRRFNVVACRDKGWLPHDYGTKAYKDMAPDEQSVVESFEGQISYSKNLNKQLFAAAPLLKIAA